MIGTTLGHYQIAAKLGEGGMGTVYRARDTRLGRDVALKLLAPELTGDPERLERFEREARALAVLDHPGVVTVFSVEEVDGARFITMQLVEGEPLDRSLPAGGFPAARLFDLALPMAEAIAAAHERGVIHRDLKPSNVMISPEGRVAILDFGLARLDGAETEEPGGDNSETRLLTQEGVVMGTMPYMSPEQVQGASVDARSDIFSFGVLLYEMATGRRPFSGENTASLISSILRDEPERVDAVREELPHHLGRIVGRCLAKRPEERHQTARDVANELRALAEETRQPATGVGAGAATTASAQRPWHRRALLAGATVALLLAALFWLTKGDRTTEPEPPADARPMAVVLPFDNLGPPEDAYFADGMTDEIISRLAAVKGLDLISRTTAFEYDRDGKSIPRIGEELRVDYVVTGTVRWARSADGSSRVKITPRLVNAEEDRQLWSESFERDLADIFAVQAEIAAKVASSLDLSLEGSETARAGADPAAYQAYLRALAHARVGGGGVASAMRQAALLAERATELDPDFLAAWELLADAHSDFVAYGVDPSPERIARARAAAERAWALAPGSVEALGARYQVEFVTADYDACLVTLEALEPLLPDADLASLQGQLYRRLGRFRESADALERAFQTDPLGKASNLAATCIMLRRYECVDRASRRGIELAPDETIHYGVLYMSQVLWRGTLEGVEPLVEALRDVDDFWGVWVRYDSARRRRDGRAILALADSTGQDVLRHFRVFLPKAYMEGVGHQLAGDRGAARDAFEAARSRLERELDERPEDARLWSTLGLTLARLGRGGEAVAAGERAVELFPLERDPYTAEAFFVDLAEVYARTGRPERAVELLEQVLSIPAMLSVPMIRTDPRWDPLRGHPAFERLVGAAIESGSAARG